MTTTQDIVARLWNLCHVLRDDGITYHEYVTELTFTYALMKGYDALLLEVRGVPCSKQERDQRAKELREKLLKQFV